MRVDETHPHPLPGYARLGAVLVSVIVLVAALPAGTGLAAAGAKPRNTSPPRILGIPQVGRTLTGRRGVWTSDPTSWSYGWVRCNKKGERCAAIPGVGTLTYTPTAADVGFALRLNVVATNQEGKGVGTSRPTALVVA
jgi:hypothetical protein